MLALGLNLPALVSSQTLLTKLQAAESRDSAYRCVTNTMLTASAHALENTGLNSNDLIPPV